MSWEQLREDADYEIFTEYPHDIRRKSTGRIISFWRTNDGYLQCAEKISMGVHSRKCYDSTV